MTTRRGFLGAILAAAVAPAVIRNAMPVKPLGEGAIVGWDLGWNEQSGIAIMERDRLFRGELGHYDGIRIIESGGIGLNDPRAVKRWAQALHEQISRENWFTREFAKKDGPLIAQPSMYERLRSG
jgi:hypothetical protein